MGRPAGVTFFIPSWNHRSYLPRALQSAIDAIAALRETGTDGEVLVIDDASRDGTQRLLRSLAMLYAGLPFRFLCLPENRGLPRLRTAALEHARFSYVCMLDADNEIIPENAPLFVRTIGDCNAAMVYGNLVERDVTDIVGLRSNEVASTRLTVGNYIDAFSFVDAEKLLELGGYVENPILHGWEDWELIMHLIAEEQTVVFVPALLGYYYVNPFSMIEDTNRREDKRMRMMRRMFSQTGTREWDSARVGRIYHPDVGYLDEW